MFSCSSKVFTSEICLFLQALASLRQEKASATCKKTQPRLGGVAAVTMQHRHGTKAATCRMHPGCGLQPCQHPV